MGGELEPQPYRLRPLKASAKVGKGGSRVWVQLRLHSGFQVSLGNKRQQCAGTPAEHLRSHPVQHLPLSLYHDLVPCFLQYTVTEPTSPARPRQYDLVCHLQIDTSLQPPVKPAATASALETVPRQGAWGSGGCGGLAGVAQPQFLHL